MISRSWEWAGLPGLGNRTGSTYLILKSEVINGKWVGWSVKSRLVNDMIELNDNNFAQFLQDAKKPVLVDFGATWCPPCRQIAPILDRLQERYQDKVIIVKVDADDSPETAKQYSVTSLPTLIMFDHYFKGDVAQGPREVDRLVGAYPEKKLADFILKYT